MFAKVSDNVLYLSSCFLRGWGRVGLQLRHQYDKLTMLSIQLGISSQVVLEAVDVAHSTNLTVVLLFTTKGYISVPFLINSNPTDSCVDFLPPSVRSEESL